MATQVSALIQPTAGRVAAQRTTGCCLASFKYAHNTCHVIYFFPELHVIPFFMWVDVRWPCSMVVHFLPDSALSLMSPLTLSSHFLLGFFSSFSPVLSFPSPSFLHSVPLFLSHAHTTSSSFPGLSLLLVALSGSVIGLILNVTQIKIKSSNGFARQYTVDSRTTFLLSHHWIVQQNNNFYTILLHVCIFHFLSFDLICQCSDQSAPTLFYIDPATADEEWAIKVQLRAHYRRAR